MIDERKILSLEAMPIEGVAKRLGLEVIAHKALCPFHDDRHPSLTFNTYKNRFKCFVCDAHGGVIDLVRGIKKCGFVEACEWLDSGECEAIRNSDNSYIAPKRKIYPPDTDWLGTLINRRELIPQAEQFLFQERKLDRRVIAWCCVSSSERDLPCWRYGKPFYNGPCLLIPYFDQDGRLKSVQSRYLGSVRPSSAQGKFHDGCGQTIPRFKFPMGSDCHIYNLPILRRLRENEELWITEGCTDCWAMLSSGKKAVAIPSATLLKREDVELLRGLNLHMFPDHDEPGERLFMALRERLPQIRRHELPTGYKDFSEWWARGETNL